jgi:hypothetical protein
MPPDEECGINTSGGLIAKGHPVGATGIAMIGWAAWQLLSKVPAPLQVRNAEHAATFNIGGPVCASVCTVLRGPQVAEDLAERNPGAEHAGEDAQQNDSERNGKQRGEFD